MDIAGHVSKQMLKHYSHIRMEAKRHALEAIVTKRPATVESDQEGQAEGYPQKSPQSGISEVEMGVGKRCKSLNLNGGRGSNRTYNLSVKSRMLCQLSYASRPPEKPCGGRACARREQIENSAAT